MNDESAPPNHQPGRVPRAEFRIDLELVAGLLRHQHPEFASLPLRSVGEGWDNAIWRLGDELTVRLPRRATAAQLLLNEQRWLPVLGPRLRPLETPVPVRHGVPEEGFPWPWSIVPWIVGEEAGVRGLAESDAEVLAGALTRLHVPAPADAPTNPFRGVALEQRRSVFEKRLASLCKADAETVANAGMLRPLFDDGAATSWRAPEVWLHGDLHPRNVLLRDGHLAAFIDWGDLTAGDPASDLAAAWMLLRSRTARRRFWSTYGGDPELRRRARGWAALFGVGLLDAGADDPSTSQLGRTILTHCLDQ